MPFAKRYFIERLTGSRTEYYDGCETPRYDGFSPDREDAELFRSEAKAQRRADRVGGEVYATTVMVSLADGFSTPNISFSPAPDWRPSESARLEAHFSIAAE